MLLSIIVPIYGVEQYLKQCLNSLVCDELVDCVEVLLIDDGSKDNCPDICDRFSSRHKNFVTFHKENGGLSDARNYGLNHARGKYIMFVDGDDYIDTDCIGGICTYLKNIDSDVIGVGSHHVHVNKIEDHCYTRVRNKEYSGIEFYKYQYKNKSFPIAVWNNLYRLKFLLDNKLYFKKGILHEDNEWIPRVFFAAKKVTLYENIFYNYFIRENSICTNQNLYKNISDLKITINELLQLYSGLSDRVAYKMLKDQLISGYLGLFGSGSFWNDHDVYLENSFIIRYLYNYRTRYKAFIYVLNKRLFCFLFDVKNHS